MNQETADTQLQPYEDSHPWLVQTEEPEYDSVGEVIRYTLDEIRYS